MTFYRYDLDDVVDCRGTVGQIGIQSDVESGDVVLWVPCYDTSNIAEIRLQ